MRRDLVVIGAGGLAREARLVAEQVNALTQEWRFLGYVAALAEDVGKALGDARVIGTDEWLLARDEPTDVVVGIGHPHARAAVARRLRESSRLRFPNVIHPAAIMGADRVQVGVGNVVTAGVVLTCDIEIGDFNYLNLNATVGHDVVIGSFNVVNPGVNLSGGATLRDEVLIGTGAQLLENVEIASGGIVGAGAVVVRDVPPDATVVGIPARPLERSQPT